MTARYPTFVVCSCGQRARRWTRKVATRAELRYVCTNGTAHTPRVLDVDGKVVYTAGIGADR